MKSKKPAKKVTSLDALRGKAPGAELRVDEAGRLLEVAFPPLLQQ